MANLSPEIALLWFATLFRILCMIDGSSEEDSLDPPPDLPPSLELLERLVDKESKSDEVVKLTQMNPHPKFQMMVQISVQKDGLIKGVNQMKLLKMITQLVLKKF